MSSTSLSPEVLVPRLGEYLVEKGMIQQVDLERALEYQKALRARGEDRLTGQILIDLGIISPATRDTVITELIFQLRTALQEANQNLLEANQQLEQRVQARTAELRTALLKLAEVNQLKANIVANISHELRTPLTHLQGYLELLLAGDLGKVNEQQHNALVIMERSSERLGRLIEDLIQFSLSEREKMQLRLEPFSVETLCKTILQKSQDKARERGLKLVLACEAGLPDVSADEEKISWVITQLIDNAIKFTPSGGTVTVSANHENNQVCVSVTDTGIGIPASQMDEIFDSFHQLDGSTTRRAGGTGLGLALAKKIIEAHNASIQVASQVSKGSIFSFNLKVFSGKKPERSLTVG
ncbi:MAG TPA: ATP-binding protein [Anaerolineaceae bacterium]